MFVELFVTLRYTSSVPVSRTTSLHTLTRCLPPPVPLSWFRRKLLYFVYAMKQGGEWVIELRWREGRYSSFTATGL